MNNRDCAVNASAIRIFVVTEHTNLLAAMGRIIKANACTMLSGSASCTADFISSIVGTASDVIVFDDDLQDTEEIEIAKLLACSLAKVLLVTTNYSDAKTKKAVLQGARGVLKLHESPVQYIDAITQVYAGQIWLNRGNK